MGKILGVLLMILLVGALSGCKKSNDEIFAACEQCGAQAEFGSPVFIGCLRSGYDIKFSDLSEEYLRTMCKSSAVIKNSERELEHIKAKREAANQ
jgi:hypothetical protein